MWINDRLDLSKNTLSLRIQLTPQYRSNHYTLSSILASSYGRYTDQSQSVAFDLCKVGPINRKLQKMNLCQREQGITGINIFKRNLPITKKICIGLYIILFRSSNSICPNARIYNGNKIINVKTIYTFMSQPLTKPYFKCRCL